ARRAHGQEQRRGGGHDAHPERRIGEGNIEIADVQRHDRSHLELLHWAGCHATLLSQPPERFCSSFIWRAVRITLRMPAATPTRNITISRMGEVPNRRS